MLASSADVDVTLLQCLDLIYPDLGRDDHRHLLHNLRLFTRLQHDLLGDLQHRPLRNPVNRVSRLRLELLRVLPPDEIQLDPLK